MIANVVTSVRMLLLIPMFVCIQARASEPAAWAALALFLTAGLTDILDGYLARKLNLVSVFGGFLDLLADRLLTTITIIALIAAGTINGPALVPALILIIRDFIVAGLGEAYVDRSAFKDSKLEKVKVGLQFLGLGVYISPAVSGFPHAHALIALTALSLAATFAVITLFDYAQRARRLSKAAKP